MRKSHLTLIILDPSDVQKPYAKKMQYLSKVWDGSKGEVGENLGFWVVVKGFGQKPMMLLTTLAQNTSRDALWQVVEDYITRWRIEDTIRHVKQSYGLEDIRLFKYDKIKAMASVLLATIYFSMTWIGNTLNTG